MYLSKITLNFDHPGARRDLANPYEMHRTLARAFAPDHEAAPARFLWRLERGASHIPSTVVLVQSAVRGNWSVLRGIPGYATEILGNKSVDLDALIQPGEFYRFRLLANPTVMRAGRRYGLVREEDQLSWLARQGARHGFLVHACMRSASECLRIRQGESGNHVVLRAALFEGVLQARSAELLRESLLKGLGHGKAFGLGMLSVAKVDRRHAELSST